MTNKFLALQANAEVKIISPKASEVLVHTLNSKLEPNVCFSRALHGCRENHSYNRLVDPQTNLIGMICHLSVKNLINVFVIWGS